MITKRFLIYGKYGFQGFSSTGTWHNIWSGGLETFYVHYDGTMVGLKQALEREQNNSGHVKDFNQMATQEGLPLELGTWIAFNVIDSELYDPYPNQIPE